MATWTQLETAFVTGIVTAPLGICLLVQVGPTPAPEVPHMVLADIIEDRATIGAPGGATRPDILPTRAEPPNRGLELALVIDALGPHLVLDPEPPDDLRHGPARSLDPDGMGDTLAQLHPADWTPRARRILGSTVALYGTHGQVCRATVAAPVVLSRLDLSGDISLLFDEEAYEAYVDSDGDVTIPPNEASELMWSSGDHVVAAPLVDLSGDCSGAVWARSVDLPAPTVLVPGKRDRAAARAFRRSAVFTGLRHQWAEFVDEAEYEGTFRDQVSRQVTTVGWSNSEGEVVRTSVGVHGAWGGCGDFEAAAWGVLGQDILRTDESSVWPVALFDADNDGRFEMVVVPAGSNLSTELALMRETPDGLAWITHVNRSFHGCPC